MRRRPINAVSPAAGMAIHLVFIACTLACLIPFLIVVAVSLTEEKTVVREGYRLVPSVLSLGAYLFLWNDIEQIVRSYLISVIVTATGTVASLLLTALYAYPLFRRDFPFRRFFSLFLFVTMVFNGGLVPFYILYTQYLHLKNTIVALILPYLLNPFFVIVMRTFLTGAIPDSLVESAKLDGAREVVILFRIIVPLALPAFATIGLFTTLVYWNDWFMSLLFISSRANVSIQYYMMKTMQNLQFMLANPQVAFKVSRSLMPSETIRMAMAVVGIGPIVVAYPFFQKYFIRGLTVGAIKG